MPAGKRKGFLEALDHVLTKGDEEDELYDEEDESDE